VVSTEKLFQTAGTYVGKDDPVALVRCQSGLPALGEVLEPFASDTWSVDGCVAATTAHSCPAPSRRHTPQGSTVRPVS